MYKRRRWNTPQALDHCSNADSIGYLDDMFKVSFLNPIIANSQYNFVLKLLLSSLLKLITL